ncbi:MAG: aspartate-semialdehyde dehydrogenase [Bacteroidales bacterium]|nr:aspartate-semialdehyde dehydrogenase [Bacteroidales bacterium]
MKIAVIGATGLVGNKILKVLSERINNEFELLVAASSKSIGKELIFKGKTYKVQSVESVIEQKPDIAIFSAGSSTSQLYAPQFAEKGTVVVDNSSAWRMFDQIPLVVPEINGDVITPNDFIIANPNCSTMQMVMALAPLHKAFKIKRLVISTYQSVTGTGIKAIRQMEAERKGEECEKAYPYPIDRNLFPYGGTFEENGYTTEETKLVNETRKILRDKDIQITATVVRVPVTGGHSEAINIEFENEYEMADIYRLLTEMPGVTIVDNPEKLQFPMPLYAEDKDDVFVGRIRRDESQPKSLNIWVVSDNLRKGAATNAVQIAELIIKQRGIK